MFDRVLNRPGGMPLPLLFCAAKRKKENKGTKERLSRQKLLNNCHQGLLFQPLQSVWNSKIFLVGQPWWPAILFSVPWPLHFEIHSAGPAQGNQRCTLIHTTKGGEGEQINIPRKLRTYHITVSNFGIHWKHTLQNKMEHHW